MTLYIQVHVASRPILDANYKIIVLSLTSIVLFVCLKINNHYQSIHITT